MSDITLSAAIRQNLLSLQNTSRDLTTTQEHLSTGKKVNTAFDNPTSYFTSQSLTNRASDLSALLDQIGQAQQTLNQANNGLTSLTSLLEQALSTAQQGQQATPATANYTTIAGGTAIANDTTQITSSFGTTQAIAGTGGNAVVASVESNVELSTAGIAQLTAGDTVSLSLGTTAVTATFGATDTATSFHDAAGLLSILNATNAFGATNGGATAVTDGAGGVTLYSNGLSTDFTNTTFTSTGLTATNLVTTAHSLGDALTLSDGTHSASFYYVAKNVHAASGTFSDNASLASAINNAASAVHSTTTATALADGDLQLAGANNVGITVNGGFGSALGFGTTTTTNNFNAQLAAITSGATLTVQVGTNAAHTLTFGAGVDDISTKTELTNALAAFTDINGGFNASNDVLLSPTSTSSVTIGGNAAVALGLNLGVTTPTATVTAASSTRTTLQGNFNALLTQIDQLAGDSSYSGVNLLTGDNLSVIYNETGTSSQTIAGVNDTSGGLGLKGLSNGEFQDNNKIQTVIGNINTAIATVRAQTETFGSNSSTITIRQSFETNVINTLQTGSSNLVLADQNQESANLLTEQTQQQLEISALSIANQANQSVLKLFP